MIGKALFLAVGLMFCGYAVAQDAAPGPGRFQIAPDGDGFVRLDTETGTLAHCDKSEGIWRCAVVAEDRTEVDRRILALQEEMAALRAEIEALEERLAAIEERSLTETPDGPAPRDGLSEEEERELDEALSFAERMMQRFFDMIRELKNEQPPQQI